MSRRRSLPFLISPEEWDLLSRERSEAFLLYSLFRMYMDYKTQISGFDHWFCEKGLMEFLSIEATNGRKEQKVTRQKCRTILSRLIKIGALVPRPDLGKLVFFLPFSIADKSVQKSYNQRLNVGITKKEPDENLLFDNENNDVTLVIDNTKNKGTTKEKPEVQPITDININNTTLGAVENFERSVIDYDFQICESIKIYVRMNLMPDPPDVDLCRLEFIEHFNELIDEKTNRVFKTTESGKTKLFRKWLIRKKMFYQRDEKNREAKTDERFQKTDKRLTAREAIIAANPGAFEEDNRSVIESEFTNEPD